MRRTRSALGGSGGGIFLLMVLLVSCAPALGPTMPPAQDAVLTATTTAAGTLYRTSVTVPVDRLVLLFAGEGLVANASECQVTPAEVTCVVLDVRSFYELVVVGEVRLVEGIVDRGGEFGLLLLAP